MKVNIGKYPKKGQRKIKVEVDNDDTWSLDYTLALIILPALKKYKKVACSKVTWMHPEIWPKDWWEKEHGDLPRPTKAQKKKADQYATKKMTEVIDKMIFAFEKIADDCTTFEDNEKIQEGLELFGKYYRALWW